jgi:hypothetical protein
MLLDSISDRRRHHAYNAMLRMHQCGGFQHLPKIRQKYKQTNLSTKPSWTDIGKIKTRAFDAAFVLAALVHDINHAWKLQTQNVLNKLLGVMRARDGTLCWWQNNPPTLPK